MVRSAVRTAITLSAHLTGLSRVLATRYGGRGMIFALHSVVDDAAFYPDFTLRCSVSKLEWALRWMREEGLDLISLDDAVKRLSSEKSRPFACFAFDDGYADNLTRALPI